MRRYIIKPRARYSEDLREECPDIGMAHTVFEPDPSPRPTGLFDVSGNELYAVDEMEPIGFVRFGS